MSPSVALLSAFKEVGPCVYLISSKASLLNTAALPLLYTLPTSASAVEDSTLFMIFHSVKMESFILERGVIVVFVSLLLK